jgi:hypothetical protein
MVGRMLPWGLFGLTAVQYSLSYNHTRSMKHIKALKTSEITPSRQYTAPDMIQFARGQGNGASDPNSCTQ